MNVDGLLRILVCLTNIKIKDQPLFSGEEARNTDIEYGEELLVEDSSETDDDSNIQHPQNQEIQEAQTNRNVREGKSQTRNMHLHQKKRRPGIQ